MPYSYVNAVAPAQAGAQWFTRVRFEIPMLKFIKKSLREHLVLTVVIGVLAPFTTFSAVSLFFASEREIVYELNEIFSQCGLSKIPGKDCTALYELIIGNTGVQEETVRLVWPFDLSPWERGQKVLNIAADQPRAHDPQIICQTSGTQGECVMDNFAPGALVIMKFSCLACSGHDAGTMEGKPVVVETTASVAHGDPRVNTLFRRMQNFLNLFL